MLAFISNFKKTTDVFLEVGKRSGIEWNEMGWKDQ